MNYYGLRGYPGNFYEVRLHQLQFDDGFTGQRRQLMRRSRNEDPEEDKLLPLPYLGGVKFDLTPTISESRSLTYVDEGLPSPVGVVVYATTGNRRFSISSRFVSRNIGEAKCNYDYVNKLRSWTVPQDREGSRAFMPPILRLNGYKKQFYNIPVVITELTINYPEDVDYVETDLAMVPILQNIEISLLETHSLFERGADGRSVSTGEAGVRGTDNDFDLEKFRHGRLPGY